MGRAVVNNTERVLLARAASKCVGLHKMFESENIDPRYGQRMIKRLEERGLINTVGRQIGKGRGHRGAIQLTPAGRKLLMTLETIGNE